MGPVHSPAAVTIPLQKNSKQPNHTKSNKQKTKTQPTKPKNTHQKSKVESDRRSSSETNDEGEVIALYQLRYWYDTTNKQTKRT